MRARLQYLAGFAGLLVLGLGTQPASAQDLNRVVGTLNRVLNPYDAQRLGDQARRNGRPAEARYWRDYRSGLEAQRRNRDHQHDQHQGNDQRRGDQGYGSSSGYARPTDPGYGGAQKYRRDDQNSPRQPGDYQGYAR